MSRKRNGVEYSGKNGTSKLTIFLFFLILLITLIFGVKLGREWKQKEIDKSNHNTMITSDLLQQQLEKLDEIATVKYYYTNMAKFEDALQVLDHNVPFTKKSFIISYDGTIKAGIVLEDISIDIVDKTIKISLLNGKILSHEVDMDSVIVYDEKNSIFNNLSAADVTSFISNQNSLMEEKAINNGILLEAKENAKDTLTSLFELFIKRDEFEEGYSIEFIEIE